MAEQLVVDDSVTLYQVRQSQSNADTPAARDPDVDDSTVLPG